MIDYDNRFWYHTQTSTMNGSNLAMLPDSLIQMVTEYVQGSQSRIRLYQELSNLWNMCEITKTNCNAHTMVRQKGKLYMISQTNVVPVQNKSQWHHRYKGFLNMKNVHDGIIGTLYFLYSR